MQSLSIAMVSDFYLPDLGGVELQIKELAKYLKLNGHKVIIITHSRPDHFGKMVVEGLTTYYLPWAYSSSGAIYPTFFMQYSEAKEILVKQKIKIVHVHQSSSTLGVSYAIYGYHLGLKIVQTEHSLFNIRSNTYLHFNWAISTIYRLYSKFICVSRAVRNNLILRCYVKSSDFIVIPNAVLSPNIRNKRKLNEKIKIVIVSRLVYRRGVDLLIKLLPQFCERNKMSHPFRIDIVGDGPKMKVLRMVVQKHNLQQMITLHGSLPNDQTMEIVNQCDIFLNTVLTESFGIALVEASLLGLTCVSTNVGGVGQILPEDRLHTVDVTPNSIIIKLEELMQNIKLNSKSQNENQRENYYKAQDCFERIVQVYRETEASKKESQKLTILKEIFFKGSLIAVILIIIFGLLSIIDALSKSKYFLQRKLKIE